jgi:hypothetical protein
MAWQEIANIVNAGNSVQRDIKEIQKKWDNICATAKTEVSLHRRSQRQTVTLCDLLYLISCLDCRCKYGVSKNFLQGYPLSRSK